jgi:hypothetical protein
MFVPVSDGIRLCIGQHSGGCSTGQLEQKYPVNSRSIRTDMYSDALMSTLELLELDQVPACAPPRLVCLYCVAVRTY